MKLHTKEGQRPKRPAAPKAVEMVGRDAQETELKFDPQRDVPIENRQLWKTHAEDETNDNDKPEGLYQYQLLFPDEPLKVDHALWQKMTTDNALYTLWLKRMTTSAAHSWIGAKTAEGLAKVEDSKSAVLFKEVILLRLVFPELATTMQAAIEEVWTYAKERVEEARQENNLPALCSVAAWARLAFPDRFSELGFTTDDLQNVRRSAQDIWTIERDASWFSGGLRAAFGLVVLSADDVRVTDQGIELTRQQKLQRGPAPLPERPQV